MPDHRIYVPVSNETRILLQSLADARRTSLASVSAELLEQTAPIAGQMAEALLKAKQAPARAIKEMSDALDEQLADIDQMKLDLDKRKPRKYTKKAKKTG